MNNIKETQGRICDKMAIMGFSSVDLVNDDGDGVVLDSVYPRSMDKKERNIEILTVYNTLVADTPRGVINLVEQVVDEDDWYTIEDVVDDLIGWDDKKYGELLTKNKKNGKSVEPAVEKRDVKKCYENLKTTREDFVETIVKLNGVGAISNDYISQIAESIADDVADDVDSSTNADWNDDDVRLAVGRVLCNRLHIVI